jgi:putative ABC transport system permease protein
VLRYTLRDLVRNPRRTLASAAGVALAVGLFSATAFFIDGSAARMTERALAPVAIDMQADLTRPLASALTVTETFDTVASLAAGEDGSISLTILNTSDRPATRVLVTDQIPAQLVYVPNSTSLNRTVVPDVAGATALATGMNLATLPAGATAKVSYRVRATAAVPATAALPLRATAASAEEPVPSQANAPAALKLSEVAGRIAKVQGIVSADQLGVLDLPAGRLTAGTQTASQQIRVFAMEPAFLEHYPMVRVTSGTFAGDTVLLSPDAATALGATPGSVVKLSVPGRAAPLQLSVGGIADFSRADPLFAGRTSDTQGEFIQFGIVLVMPLARFLSDVLPAVKLDAASNAPVLQSPPVLEVDVRLDRSRLATDPTVATLATQGLKRSIERLAPGGIAVLDNVSDALNAATGDVILAKILFLFLGLPGVLLAAYLSRYAGGLLAQSRRREQAILRARGAQPRHLVSGLAFAAVGVTIVGSVLGLILGAVTAAAVLGLATLRSGSTTSLVQSALVSVVAGIVTTLVAVYIPGRRALSREIGEERREMEVLAAAPVWLRMRLDLVLLGTAAVVWIVTSLAGGFKITQAEGQSVSLSFYTLLAPLLAWLGLTLLAVRLLLGGARRLKPRAGNKLGRLTTGTLLRSASRRSLAIGSGIVAAALAVAFGSSVALFIATYDAQKQADARFVVGSDLRVTPSLLSQQPSEFATKLRIPGVTSVSPVVQSSSIVGTDKRMLVAVDPTTFPATADLSDAFFPGSSAASLMAAMRKDPAAVLVSTEMTKTFNIQPGDNVNMQLVDRAGRMVPVTMHAAGVFKEFPGYAQGIDLVTNIGFYQTATATSQVSFFLVRTSDSTPAGVARVADAIRSGPSRSTPMLIETTVNAVNKDASTLTALNLRGLGGLQSLYTVLISAASIGIFVFGLLLQRRKEYVTMRALGIRIGQLWALVFGEAAIVAIVSLVIGSIAGVVMAVMFVQILAPLFTIQPSMLTVPGAQLVVLATLVLGGMAISVALAARSLRRINPVELLREE